MFKRCIPVSKDPAEQLIEILNFNMGETLQIEIKVNDVLASYFQVMNLAYRSNDHIEELKNIISIRSRDGDDQPILELKKDCIVSIKNIFYTEEITWKKDSFEIQYKNDITIIVDILE